MSHYSRRMSKNLGYTSRTAGLNFRVAESTTVQESVLGLLIDGAGTAYTELQVRERLGLPKSSTHRALKKRAYAEKISLAVTATVPGGTWVSDSRAHTA